MQKILTRALYVKIALWILALFAEKVITCKDESTQVYYSGIALENITGKPPLLDRMIRWTLSPFMKWDSHYFTSVAERGYTHEKIFAFYPLYPLMMRFLSKCLFFIWSFPSILSTCCIFFLVFPFLLPRTAILLAGFLITTASNLGAIYFLYHLTLGIFHNVQYAELTALCYAVTPASCFTTALFVIRHSFPNFPSSTPLSLPFSS